MEGFTLSLALVDAIPVLLFGASMMRIGMGFRSPLFLAGAVLSTLAGCCKVLWKLVLGIWHKDLRWLNKPFVPTQATGFLLILLSFATGFGKINWFWVLQAVSGFPAVLCFALWLALMGTMGWYRKTRFDHSAKANWTAEIINTIAQAALLAGILLAR